MGIGVLFRGRETVENANMVNPDTHRDTPPSKTAVPPVIVKKDKLKDDDEDGVSGPPPTAKEKLLPTGLSRSIVIAALLASIAFATSSLLADRYELVPAPNSANGFMYRIDRLLGSVQFCGPQGCSDLPHPEK